MYKQWQKTDPHAIEKASTCENLESMTDAFGHDFDLPANLSNIFVEFATSDGIAVDHPRMYGAKNLPGLFYYPKLLPASVQISLLDKLLHRDLSNPEHKTNLHLHYDLSYPPPTSYGSDGSTSFFDAFTDDVEHAPKELHAPLTTTKMLNRKLRWITLGGQYDWTNKVYPSGPPPPFPADIKQLVDKTFPMEAEAAIVNLYSPGDTLSVHRDVSEECAQPLVSISIGCDAVFIVALEDEEDDCINIAEPRSASTGLRSAVLRLRSGDAVLMSGESRYAWHGVPKVIAGTCPDWLQDWPAVGSEENVQRFKAYKGWMGGKRINLNVRQMFTAGHGDNVWDETHL
ncbi:hypothetical protein LTR62_008310 [Meristemomyces frigidus]|uniref:mRNA N(6)-methyladenine demethylase n=1 Tax=Meristemomyces frigidus TaxID=1508187 RepID=A0AAN7T9T1_9PEZI|nr:hypothetical protein LTR62_008310 [Meristemomyces frigidus]